MLTQYLESLWVSFSISEYVAKCTILFRVNSQKRADGRADIFDFVKIGFGIDNISDSLTTT
jgi:hypothetical protein